MADRADTRQEANHAASRPEADHAADGPPADHAADGPPADHAADGPPADHAADGLRPTMPLFGQRPTVPHPGLRPATARMVVAAVGILMEQHDLSSKGAFDYLRRMSAHSNIEVRDLATRLVEDRPGNRPATGITPA